MDFIDFTHILKKILNFFVITVILIFILLQKFSSYLPIDKTGETSDGKDCRHPHQKGKQWREKKTPVLPETKILLKFEEKKIVVDSYVIQGYF